MSQANVIAVNPQAFGEKWQLPDRGTVGVAMLILTEAVLFMIFAAAYLVYIGKSTEGPFPADVLQLPILSTICLLSSSLTIYFAEHALIKGDIGKFRILWFATFLLGAEFLTATGIEWHRLITKDHLTISTNLFGTTFYSLVGLHASHVVVGLILMLVALAATLFGHPMQRQVRRVRFLSWYWHFVDAVWVVVFCVVYLIGR